VCLIKAFTVGLIPKVIKVISKVIKKSGVRLIKAVRGRRRGEHDQGDQGDQVCAPGFDNVPITGEAVSY
jgi:hypothetical protein